MLCMSYEGKCYGHKCVIYAQSTKIGTNENKAIHSKFYVTGSKK